MKPTHLPNAEPPKRSSNFLRFLALLLGLFIIYYCAQVAMDLPQKAHPDSRKPALVLATGIGLLGLGIGGVFIYSAFRK